MIELNPETHIYKDTETGRIIPGVTSIIGDAGLSNFNAVSPDILERSQKFGSAVHLTTALYDEDDLDMDSLDPALKLCLEAWIKFRGDMGFIVHNAEQIVYSKKYDYAGTYDRVGSIDSIETLIDIKTGTSLPKTIALQTAAYMEAYNEGRKREERIKRRLVIQLLENGTYKMQEYKERSDFSVFLACLNLRNWRKINNIKGK